MTLTVKAIARRVLHSKWFDRQAARRTNELYLMQFGLGVSKRLVRGISVSHVLWIETDQGQTAGAMMLSRQGVVDQNLYRVQGLAVAPEFQHKGYGSALLSAADTFVGTGAVIWLCVDKYRSSTDWLVKWYCRMGYELASLEDVRLHFTDSEIPLIKTVK